MRRRNFWIEIRAQIKPGRGPIFIRQNLGAFRNVGLSRNALGYFDSEFSEARGDYRHHIRIMPQLQAQQFSCNIARDIVSGGGQAACHKHEVSTPKCFRECAADCRSIRHGNLTIDSQSEGKKLTREERQMGIENFTKQEFCARIDDDRSHSAIRR